MGFDRSRLPDARDYYEAQGLALGKGRKWVTTSCAFHGGSDSMRINLQSGCFVCMACGARGGDVIAYEMAVAGEGFIAAARKLGCWVDDGQPAPARPTQLSPRAALQALALETMIAAIEAARVANGAVLNDVDRARLLQAAQRIQHVAEVFG
jgi:DNA primase